MNLQARRLLGAALLRTGDAAGALDTLRPIALRRDADSYTLGLVARAFEAQGQRDWAARFLDRAAAMPSSPAAPFGQDDDPAALATAVAENRADPRAMVSLVRGRLEAGQGGAALVEAQALARQSPGAPAAHVLIGDVLFATGRAGAAAASYARAADLRFDRATMLRLVEARLISGDRRGAADALALYLAQHPADIAARRALANAQLMTDPASARETLDPLLIELGGRDALLLALVARARVAAGDAGAALAPARAAYRLQPMNATIADAYGLALLATGDAGGARQLLDKAIALAPGRADIRAHRAQAGE
jgi:predicted Zn-dependent protease